MSWGQTKLSLSLPATNLTSEPSDLGRALAACRRSFLTTAFFSLFVNLLMLVPAIYMLAIYDRVLMSGSESTLMMLTVMTVFLFLVLGGLEWIRTWVLVATSARLDKQLGERVFDAVFARSLTSSGAVATAQPLNDLLQIRQFLTGPGLPGFFDVPWMPIYGLNGSDSLTVFQEPAYPRSPPEVLEDAAVLEGYTVRCYATSCILLAKSRPDVDGGSGLPSLW